MLRGNESAVSPVIGSMLMVAITMLLVAAIAAFFFALPETDMVPVNAVIVVSNNPDKHNAVDIRLQHKGGDTLKAGHWKISIVPEGQTPVFVTSNTDGTFSTGDQIITSNITVNGSYTTSSTGLIVTNRGVYYGGPYTGNDMVSGKKYDVKLVVLPSNVILLDTVVEVR